MARAISWRDPHHEFRLCTQRLGVMQRPVAANQPKPGAVLAVGDDLRRQWDNQLRVAKPPGSCPDALRCWCRLGTSRRRGRACSDVGRDARSLPCNARHIGFCQFRRSGKCRASGEATRRTRHLRAERFGGDTLASVSGCVRRRQPGARQHAAVPRAQFHHCAAGHLSFTRLAEPPMADPYIGEIRMFGGNFEPNGWAFCSGQLLPISEYEALFNLIGTTVWR